MHSLLSFFSVTGHLEELKLEFLSYLPPYKVCFHCILSHRTLVLGPSYCISLVTCLESAYIFSFSTVPISLSCINDNEIGINEMVILKFVLENQCWITQFWVCKFMSWSSQYTSRSAALFRLASFLPELRVMRECYTHLLIARILYCQTALLLENSILKSQWEASFNSKEIN